MRVVMGTGYAGPGWVWPKADMPLGACLRAAVWQPNGTKCENATQLGHWVGDPTPLSNAPLWGVNSKPRPLGGVVYKLHANKFYDTLRLQKHEKQKPHELAVHGALPSPKILAC
jgi:hypothetical protein